MGAPALQFVASRSSAGNELGAWVDAAHADCPITRKSTCGQVVMFNRMEKQAQSDGLYIIDGCRVRGSMDGTAQYRSSAANHGLLGVSSIGFYNNV